MTRAPRSLIPLALLALAGCGHLVPRSSPAQDVAIRLTPAGPSPWTEDFSDPVLGELLRRGDRAGLTPKLALARLEKADAEVRASGVGRTPNLVAGLSSAVGGQSFDDVRVAGAPMLELRQEIDVWGRLARTRDAARAERRGAAEDVVTARLQLAAEIARSYAALVVARRSIDLADQRVDLARSGLEIEEARRRAGTVGPQVVAARQLNLARATDLADLARRQAAIEMARLTDLTDGPVRLPAGEPSVAGWRDDRPVEAAPSSQVDGRPDVKAAFARFQAADAARAAAVAAARPQFRIAAAVGAPDASIATLLDLRALTWAAALTLSQDLLDGGARKARIQAAGADADEAEIAYRQTVLAAWQEMREAAAKAEAARRDAASAEVAAEHAHAAVALGEARHAAGVLDGQGLTELRSAALDAEQALAEARLQSRLARVGLALARGGA